MIFDEIQDNAQVRKVLTDMVDSGRIPHAIMFHEDDGGGAVRMCLGFLEYLMRSSKVSKLIHPDIHFVFPVAGGSIIPAKDKPTSQSYLQQWRQLVLSNPYFTESDLNEALGIESKSAIIAVAEAKQILEKLAFNALEGGYQAVVIYLPERMNMETANRLLKSIEEPPERTEFLLITHAPERVLTTISSRCQSIRLIPVQRSEAQGSASCAEDVMLMRKLFSALSVRDLCCALEVGESIAALPSRERMKSFCRTCGEGLRQMVLIQQGYDSVLPVQDAAYWQSLSGLFKKQFARRAMDTFSRAYMLVDRNVNPKIIFCDLVDRLFTIL